jgi:clan AA aspartic protease (TIGR02281 family)
MRRILILLLLLTGPAVAGPGYGEVSHETSTLVRLGAGGVLMVATEINGALKAEFLLDTGAATVVLTGDAFARLRGADVIRDADMVGGVHSYTMADGMERQWQTFTLRTVRVGGVTLANVRGSTSPEGRWNLIGQSFLSRLKSWHFDNLSGELLLEPRPIK